MGQKVFVCDDEPSTRYPVFTRGNVGEVFIEAVSPLTWSAYGPHSWDVGWRDAFFEMGVFTPDEFKPEGQCEIVGCFGGYVYINMSVTRVMAVRIPGLTVQAIDASLFGDYPDVPPYRPDPRDQNAERSRQVSAWLATLFSANPKTATDHDARHIDALIARRPQFSALSDARLLDYYRSLRSENRRIFKRHVLNTYGANVLSSLITQITQAVGAGDQCAAITAAAGDVDSARPSYDLWALSRQIRSTPALTSAFDRGVPGLLVRLRASEDPSVRDFLAQWDRFIDEWGFLGPSVWEFRSPTYRTDPEIALRMLERLRRAPDAAAPSARAAMLSAQRQAATAQVAQSLAQDKDSQARFLAAAQCVSGYLAARERSKHQCARLIDEIRAPLRELGQRLVARGQLSRWEDLLLVTLDEADAYVANPSAYPSMIADRRGQLELLKGKEPPFVFEGEPLPLSAFRDRAGIAYPLAATGSCLSGIGVSPGLYTGRARHITSLDTDSELEPGEVIVAITTDASWGPLFLTAGAVVVETGAAISHAAIVARELGIPAVASVAGATQRIAEGATITVDGNNGTVQVH